MISGASELELSYMEQIMDLQKELEYQKEMEEEFNKKHTKLMQKYSKQKEVLDKIKEILLYKYPVLNSDMDDLKQELLELLEEIK